MYRERDRAELLTTVIIASVIAIAVLAHGYNMFAFPYYENDEGTYVSRAWAVLTTGELAPYTYWYDHAPAGWLAIAVWAELSGGFDAFGFSINSGRVLMLIVHAASSLLVFGIAKRLTGSNLAGAIAVLASSLSPLAIFFQRRVLLDNLMIFWVLLALFLIIANRNRRLSLFAASAVAFAIAVLTKEPALIFFPSLIYALQLQTDRERKTLISIGWIFIVGALISLYAVFALLKGEFFPPGFFGETEAHVSLFQAVQYQLQKDGGFFLTSNSRFMENFIEWLGGGDGIPLPDPFLMSGGIIATFTVAIAALWRPWLGVISLPTALYWLFLIRGGDVIGFYIIPLIPFLALNISIAIHLVLQKLKSLRPEKHLRGAVMVILFLPWLGYYTTNQEIYTRNQTEKQVEAVRWIQANIPSDSIILIDNYAFIDLRTKIPASIGIQKDAHYYWEASRNPEIKEKLLQNDWRNVDFMLATPQMWYDASHSNLELITAAYENSSTVRYYPNDGWDIEVRRVEPHE